MKDCPEVCCEWGVSLDGQIGTTADYLLSISFFEISNKEINVASLRNLED